MANDMANGDMANTRCPKCNALLAIVGRSHLCRPRVLPPVVEEVATEVGKAKAARKRTGEAGTSTYRFRDPEKRRVYQRDLMKKRRAKTAEPTK